MRRDLSLPGPEAGVPAQTLGFHRDPLGFLRAAQGRFGDVFAIRLLSARPLAVVADPESAATLLAADHGFAAAGEARRTILPFASTRSVFGGDGERHRAARARVAPAFAAAAMAPRRPAIGEIAARQAERWPRDRPFRLLEAMREITDEVFVRLVLGVREEAIATDLIAAVRRMLRTPGNPPLTLPGEGDGLAGALGERLFRRRAAPVAEHLGRAIEARRGEGPAGDPDVLSGMLEAEPTAATATIFDELISLLMAAQEPPAIALAWLADRAGRSPEVAAALTSDPEGTAAQAAIAETLRLQPPASAALRRLHRPLTVSGLTLPAGIAVLLPTSLLQRDHRCFPQPDRFQPSRWTGDPPPAGSYFPFGGGARRCVGEALARAEFAAVLPAVLGRLRLIPLSPEPEPMVQRATVLCPKRSLLVRAEPS